MKGDGFFGKIGVLVAVHLLALILTLSLAAAGVFAVPERAEAAPLRTVEAAEARTTSVKSIALDTLPHTDLTAAGADMDLSLGQSADSTRVRASRNPALAILESMEETATSAPMIAPSYNERTVKLLARLINTEAGGIKNLDERTAVGLTVLYRTDAKNWPDTVSSNIFKPYQYADPSESYSAASYEAAKEALRIWSGGESAWKMPEKYIYFFGDGRRNYFYCYKAGGGVEFYEFPGRPNPANVYELYEKIVLKKG